jgi:hypothetical protein
LSLSKPGSLQAKGQGYWKPIDTELSRKCHAAVADRAIADPVP